MIATRRSALMFRVRAGWGSLSFDSVGIQVWRKLIRLDQAIHQIAEPGNERGRDRNAVLNDASGQHVQALRGLTVVNETLHVLCSIGPDERTNVAKERHALLCVRLTRVMGSSMRLWDMRSRAHHVGRAPRCRFHRLFLGTAAVEVPDLRPGRLGIGPDTGLGGLLGPSSSGLFQRV